MLYSLWTEFVNGFKEMMPNAYSLGECAAILLYILTAVVVVATVVLSAVRISRI